MYVYSIFSFLSFKFFQPLFSFQNFFIFYFFNRIVPFFKFSAILVTFYYLFSMLTPIFLSHIILGRFPIIIKYFRNISLIWYWSFHDCFIIVLAMCLIIIIQAVRIVRWVRCSLRGGVPSAFCVPGATSLTQPEPLLA